MVRAPLLPVERFLEGHTHTCSGASLLPEELPVRAALAVGTKHLFAALERTGETDPDAPRLRRKLLRYVIRMATRPTPFGLFAGVGLIEWGPVTDVAIAARPPRTRARPDMGWLLELVAKLEHDPGVRRQLGLFANPLALTRAGRVFLCETAYNPDSDDPALRVSIRATAAVQRVLTRAATPATHAELASELLSVPGATPAKIDKLIDELWQQSFLLTDLRPPLTGINPGRYVCDHLSALDVAKPVRKGLSEVMHALERWDALPLEERVDGWSALTKQTTGLHEPQPPAETVQVDMALPLGGTRVHPGVAKEAARAAELLLRMTPYPNGLPYLHAYRTRFEGRYGPAREVPLLELLDPEFGLGRPDEDDRPRSAQEPGHESERQRTLTNLAIDALRERRLVVDLDEALVSRLETSSPTPDTMPRSLEISVLVAATSQTAIDAGDFTVIVGPNLGVGCAGRGLGRFADLLGGEAIAALRALGHREDLQGGRLAAELVYLPQQARSANVAVRPAIVDYEIPCGTTAGGPSVHVIPLEELVVGVRDKRFYVRWPTAGADIAISEKHMLNPLYAPPAIRFLQDVEGDGRALFTGFGWGTAGAFAFLPRVQHGRVVLALAQWRVDGIGELAPADDFQRALRDWRARWLVPRYVYLADADQRLLLDLDNREHGELLREELRLRPARQGTVIQEALPGPADAWLPGPRGRHIVEFVVPLAPRARALAPREHLAPVRVAAPAPPAVRLRPPGSDWLYLKLYCPPTLQDDLIADQLAPFADFATSAAFADRWFFVRYFDTGPHLRIRFHGDPDVLLNRLLPQTCAWAAGLVADGSCMRFGFDTYEREVERYGGGDGIAVAEELFAADSRAVAKILRVGTDRHALDRITRAVLSVDTLLDGFGMDATERLAWYRAHILLSRIEGPEYRRRQEQLRQLFAHGPAVSGGADPLALLLDDRRHVLRAIAVRWDDLAQDGKLGLARTDLYAACVHMHCNRLLGIEPATEKLVLRLARRTLESLSRQRPADGRTAFRH